jgi:hypothetical protein
MSEVGPSSVPTTVIAGVRGLTGRHSPFGTEPNDGLVSLSEVSAEWLTDQVQLPIFHTILPSSRRVAEVILNRLARDGVDSMQAASNTTTNCSSSGRVASGTGRRRSTSR